MDYLPSPLLSSLGARIHFRVPDRDPLQIQTRFSKMNDVKSKQIRNSAFDTNEMTARHALVIRTEIRIADRQSWLREFYLETESGRRSYRWDLQRKTEQVGGATVGPTDKPTDAVVGLALGLGLRRRRRLDVRLSGSFHVLR